MQRFYPAVFERGTRETFGVWFPDFPRCVVGGTSQEKAIARAQEALAQAVQSLAERERELPQPTRPLAHRIANDIGRGAVLVSSWGDAPAPASAEGISMRLAFLAALSLSLAFSSFAVAQDDKDKGGDKTPSPNPAFFKAQESVTQGSANGVDYSAHAGTLIVHPKDWDDATEPTGDM